MAAAGLPAWEHRAAPGMDGGLQAAQALLDQGAPDGVLCAEDELAVGVLKGLTGRGLRVPEDAAVIGYNNSLLARCTHPELASVDGKVGLLGACALETMLQAIETGTAEMQTVVMPELILRGSACPG
jgi:LacI family transcriptional regulator/LacI family asc operon transcriptional repressor